MLKRSIDSFLKRDAKTAAAICNEDDAIDAL
jgi:phosphate uptake regulator